MVYLLYVLKIHEISAINVYAGQKSKNIPKVWQRGLCVSWLIRESILVTNIMKY